MNVKKLEIRDATGVIKNIHDVLHEFREDNVEALALCYTRKSDGSSCAYLHGVSRIMLIGTLEQLKYDVLNECETAWTEYEEE